MVLLPLPKQANLRHSRSPIGSNATTGWVMSQSVTKQCYVCGQDVSRQPRTKDANGNYYCQPCYDSAMAESRGVTATSEQSGGYTCATCGEAFGVNDVYDDGGTVICKACHGARTPTIAPSVAATLRTSNRSTKKTPTLWKPLVFGVIGVLLAIRVVAWVLEGTGYVDYNEIEAQRAKRQADEAQAESQARHEKTMAELRAKWDAAGSSGLPSIAVRDANGGTETSVRFSGWHKKEMNYGLHGTATWNGDREIDEMRYEVKRGGTRIRSGRVYVEGGYIRKNEPTAVSLSIGEEPTSDMVITIEVQH